MACFFCAQEVRPVPSAARGEPPILASGGADAALAASLFHFHELDIGDLKRDLAARGIPVRL